VPVLGVRHHLCKLTPLVAQFFIFSSCLFLSKLKTDTPLCLLGYKQTIKMELVGFLRIIIMHHHCKKKKKKDK